MHWNVHIVHFICAGALTTVVDDKTIRPNKACPPPKKKLLKSAK